MRYYEFVHNLGIHSWDIPALIVAVILTLRMTWIRRSRKSAKRWQKTSRKWQQVKLYRQEKQFRQMELPKYKKEVSR